jgi:hypothetical protein
MKIVLLALSALLLFAVPGFAAQEPPTLSEITKEVQRLQKEADALKIEADKLTKPSGPTAMSVDDVWDRLQKLLENASTLVDEIHLLSANVNSNITLISGELIRSISALRDNVNMISQGISSLANSTQENLSLLLNERLPKMLLTFNQDVSRLINTIQTSVDNLSLTIERAIKDLSAMGVQQINAIGDKVGTLIVTVNRGALGIETIITSVNDFAQDMSMQLGLLVTDMSVLIRSVKDAAIQHIDLVSQNIVQVVQTIRQGVENVSNVISARISDIGNVIVGLIQNVSGLILEVKEMVGTVGDDVKEVSDAIGALSRNTVDYLKQVDVELVPRVYFGTFRDATGKKYYADSGLTLSLHHLVRDNPNHIIELGVETLDGKTTFNAMYGRRLGLATLRLGYLRGQPAVGYALGTASGDTEWLWELGAMGSYRSKATLDLTTQFGKRNGLRGFFEVRDVASSSRRYIGGLGMGIQF